MKNIENYCINNSLNRSYINKNSYYTKNKNISKSKTFEKDIINSMKESLDTFLINLKTKSSSKDITNDNLENYYLNENEKFNSLNLDLISPYQALIKNNFYTNNTSTNKQIKRALSTGEFPAKNNNSQIYYNNYNKNSYKINSLFDKNLNEITQSNSLFYSNINDSMNKSLTITNYNNIVNLPKKIYEKKQNIKIDYPIKLINNNNTISNLNFSQFDNNNKSLFSNAKKSFENSRNFHKNVFLKEKRKLNNNIILYIKKELKKLKINNNQNKKEINEFYSFYSQLIQTIFSKILYYVKNFENGKMNNLKNEILILKSKLNSSNTQGQKLNQENENFKQMINQYKSEKNENYNYNKIIEEKNNNIFLLQQEIKSKENKINDLTKEQEDQKKTIKNFQKIMKDVKITLKDYENLQKKEAEFQEILKKNDFSKDELNNKIKELTEKNDKMKSQINIYQAQKRSLSKENEKNKCFIDSYKNNFDMITKEKDELKKEKEKLINEIKIIKKNNKRINNIKINNNIKIMNNTKLREKINTLNKEKNILETKYNHLQKSLEEQAMKNRSLSYSILKSSNLKHKKFYNLFRTKNKSFVIFNINKTKEQQQRMSKIKKKFKKLTISNKIVILYKSDTPLNISKNKLNKNKNSSQNIEINSSKNPKIINNKNKDKKELKSNTSSNKKKYINKIYNSELFSILGNENYKEEQIDVSDYITKINELKKQIEEKDKYINLLENEKNNPTKTQVISIQETSK